MKSKKLRALFAFSAFLAVIVSSTVIFALPISALTEGPYTDGGYFEYTVTDDKATITKVHLTPNNLPPLSESIEIPEIIGKDHDVVAIAPNVFEDCIKAESIILPKTLESIGNSAFIGCTALKNINLPEGLKTIGASAFEGCSALESITLPSTLDSIGSSAFADCTALDDLVIPENVDNINKWAFDSCTSLKSITFRGTSTRIAEYAFLGCREDITLYCSKESSIHKYALNSLLNYKLVIFNDDNTFELDTSRDTLKELHEQGTQASQPDKSSCGSSFGAALSVSLLSALASAVIFGRRKELK